MGCRPSRGDPCSLHVTVVPRITPLHSSARDLICSVRCHLYVYNVWSSVLGLPAPFYLRINPVMVRISKAPAPRTPVRRLSRLMNISRPNDHPRTASRFIQAVRSTNRTGEVSVAIQNEDATEDAVVITSLDNVPFCCHADLLLMNREQLLAAASVLNERLPAALQIDTDRSESYIRNSVEFIVGIRSEPPDAPVKPATPSRKFVPSSPISPLAKRGHSHNSQLAVSSSLLGDVTEEEEPEGSHIITPHQPCKRPLKRRKLIRGPVSPTPPHIQLRPSTLQSLGSMDTRRITRSQSTRATRPLQPPVDRVLRSHSQRVDPKNFTIVTPHPSLHSFCTPNRRVRSSQAEPSSGGISTSPACALAESSVPDTPSPTPRVTRRKFRKDSSVEREAGMVKELQRMNIPPVGSDD